jgi:hypothetical protein
MRANTLLHQIWHEIAGWTYKKAALILICLPVYGLSTTSIKTLLESKVESGVYNTVTPALVNASSIFLPYDGCLSLKVISTPSNLMNLGGTYNKKLKFGFSAGDGETSYPILKNSKSKIYAKAGASPTITCSIITLPRLVPFNVFSIDPIWSVVKVRGCFNFAISNLADAASLLNFEDSHNENGRQATSPAIPKIKSHSQNFLSFFRFDSGGNRSPTLTHLKSKWWLGAELNRRHKDFQSSALPTELPSQPPAFTSAPAGYITHRRKGAASNFVALRDSTVEVLAPS